MQIKTSVSYHLAPVEMVITYTHTHTQREREREREREDARRGNFVHSC
jgi:hypothetical protein